MGEPGLGEFGPGGLEISDAELDEFLAGDHDPVQADPEFRARLREELWALIQDGQLGRRQDH